jgi:hypothetical protein
MAGSSQQLEELKLSESSPCDSKSVTAPTSEGDRATTLSSILQAQRENTMEREKSGECSSSTKSVDEQIELSKAHYSVLGESGAIEEEQESDYVTAAAVPAGESDDATESKLPFMTALEERIEKSKGHWSTLADQSGSVEGEEVAEVSNVAVFLALQSHPSWGSFFTTFGYELDGSRYRKMGELELGEKFAEGGQAEIYNAYVTWWNLERNERDLREGK